MAHDVGFSARRPRETLAGISHNASAIPLPASAMKPSSSSQSALPQAPYTAHHARSVSGSRMSLAPGRPAQPLFHRSSSGSNLADMGFATAQRTSTSNVFGPSLFASAGGRRSYAPVTPAHGAQLQMSTQRRSSVYSARQSSSMGQIGHQSFFAAAPIAAGDPIDARPLRNRGYQAQISQELMEYMTQNNFEMDMKYSLRQQTMSQPTQQEFNYMFQWLYRRIDPNYRFQKSIDVEVPPILQQLKYPFQKSVSSRSQLAAVGGQKWYLFLGMLHWLMQVAKMTEQYKVGSYDDACIEAGIDISQDRIVFDFLADAYHTWLSADDDGDDQDAMLRPHVDAMARKFEQANAGKLEQVKTLEHEHRTLQDRIDELAKNEPRLKDLEEQIHILEDDEAKFKTYTEALDGKVEAKEQKARLLQQEIDKLELELRSVEEEKAGLQQEVDRQGITIEDIDRMNTERERLQKGVETTAQRLDDSKRRVLEKELDASERLDQLEKSVQEFNSLGYQVEIIPETARHAKGQKYEFDLQVNSGPDFSSSQARSDSSEADRLLTDSTTGYSPQHLLNLDAKGHVKFSIMTMRKEASQRRNSAAEADMENKEMLDKVRDAIEEKQQEVEGLGHRVRAAEEEFEKTREITNAQKMASDAQVEKLERELGRMRTTMTESVQSMEQREMNTNMEYEQLTLGASSLREELHTEVDRMLNDIIRFKLHIQKSLEDYEQFVAEEVEKECEEQDGQSLEDGGWEGAED